MGYTHYWTHPHSASYRQAWPGMVTDARTIVDAVTRAGIALAGPAGTGRPRTELKGIRLNGDMARGQSYETFIVWAPTTSSDSNAEVTEEASHIGDSLTRRRPVDFCKTARRPYDLAVTAVLLRCHLLLPEEFLIDSDGAWDTDWAPARHLLTTLFGPIPKTDQLTRL